MTLGAYEDLVHALARLDADAAASGARASRRLEGRRSALAAVRSDLDEETGALAELCASLRHAAPDLTPVPFGDAEAGGEAGAVAAEAVDAGAVAGTAGDVDAVLARAREALEAARAGRVATVRAAQRPTMMPKVHHVVRELLLYGACMIACLLAQFAYLGAAGGVGSSWWIVFLPPVGAALVGYLLVGAANRPRLPMLDRSGKPVKAVVPHNPRLGVTLAVCTMALFTYFAFFA